MTTRRRIKTPTTYWESGLSPCKTCPFRRDVPLMYWVRDEYEMLQESERQSIRPLGILFGCHKYRNQPNTCQVVCAGWLEDQKRRNVPSIHLRMALAGHSPADPEVVKRAIDTVSDGGHRLYDSIDELVKANLAAFDLVRSTKQR